MSEKPTAPAVALPTMPAPFTSAQLTAGLLAIAALEFGQGFLAPLLVGVLLSVALVPPVRWLARVMPRAVAAAIVVLAIAGAGAGTAYVLSDDAIRSSRELPALLREVRTAIASASSRAGVLRQLQQAVSELEHSTRSAPSGGAAKVTIVEPLDVQWGVMAGTRRIARLLGDATLLSFLVYFLLAAGDLFRLKFVRLAGDRLSHRKVTVQMLDEITDKIGRFMVYQAWSGVVVGAATWLAFHALGVRYAGLWGVAAGLLNWVPYFGPTVVMAASAAAAFVQFHSPAMAAGVAAVSLVITGLEGFVAAPLLLGRAARVNTVATFVALMFWGWLWGGVGLLVAVPVLMVVKTVADHVEPLRSLSELLGERDPAGRPAATAAPDGTAPSVVTEPA